MFSKYPLNLLNGIYCSFNLADNSNPIWFTSWKFTLLILFLHIDFDFIYRSEYWLLESSSDSSSSSSNVCIYNLKCLIYSYNPSTSFFIIFSFIVELCYKSLYYACNAPILLYYSPNSYKYEFIWFSILSNLWLHTLLASRILLLGLLYSILVRLISSSLSSTIFSRNFIFCRQFWNSCSLFFSFNYVWAYNPCNSCTCSYNITFSLSIAFFFLNLLYLIQTYS